MVSQATVSEDAPHFFGDVRGKRVQQLDEGFARFAVALVHLHHFVVEDHQLANRGVEAHVLDVACHLDDGLVHHLIKSPCGYGKDRNRGLRPCSTI